MNPDIVGNFGRLQVLARAASEIIKAHDKAASEEEAGFKCGCKDCQKLMEALELIEWNKK